MTIDEFRTHDTFPGRWAKELAQNEILRIVLAVMQDNHPSHFALAGDRDEDISPTRASIELGLTRGYSKYGDTLFLLAKRKVKLVDPGEPTYAKEEAPK